ncbi:hypothetical protein [Trinickia mobilis]|uniref:hypothetical protein n=1 Tax=Trinickia mobilis TaxID=2816356 RepID=UPI001A8D1EFA|nr:hypothetical protein [Trinickia mobilis]
MGQAKRRGTYEERVVSARGPATWFHGTAAEPFSAWQFPPPPPPFMSPHSAVFLSPDREFAADAGNRVCSASLQPDARVVNVLSDREASESLRTQLARSRLGSRHAYVRDRAAWRERWETGEIMRYATDDVSIQRRVAQRWPDVERYRAGARDEQASAAWLMVQNLTRDWIEEIVIAARGQGVDALIGWEVDSDHPAGTRAVQVLFALTPRALTAPYWGE